MKFATYSPMAAALLAAGFLCLSPIASSHGGTYLGPGDTVPPAAGGGGGGGGSPPPTGGPSPGNPNPPDSGGGVVPSPPTGGPIGGAKGGAPSTSPTGQAFVLDEWSYWWEFNKAGYLNLRDALNRAKATTGDVGWFTGQGQQIFQSSRMRPTRADIQDRVVPALLKALETETNNDIITGCMIALAKIGQGNGEQGGSSFAEAIRPFLKDSSQEISETAALSLGILAQDQSIALLLDLLNDTQVGRTEVGRGEVSRRTRTFAAYGLSLVGRATAKDALRVEIANALRLALLGDESATRDIEVACVIALGNITLGKGSPELALQEDDISTAEQQAEFLLAYFQDRSNPYLARAHCPRSMARLAQESDSLGDDWKAKLAASFMGVVQARTSSEKDAVVQSCVLALGLLGDRDGDELDKRIRKCLREASGKNLDSQSRYFSLVALGQVGAREGNPEDNAGVPEIQKHFLSRMVKGAGANSTMRPWSALGAGLFVAGMGDETPLPIVQALNSQLAEERTARVGGYAIAAGLAGQEDSIPVLQERLTDVRDDQARGYICVALGMLDAKEAKQDVRKIVSESTYNGPLLRQAAIGLGLLGDEEAVADLVEKLSLSKSLTTQAALAGALGFIGDRTSLDPLVDLLGNSTRPDAARGFAAAALGSICAKEDLPWNYSFGRDINYRASTYTLTGENGTGILDIL
ncbi:MAG: HEAT repeat domain-containing protein [Planctomycetota bacterium]|nr:HEAT repeat domain-containing protein [Planctomycetota bacterium]